MYTCSFFKYVLAIYVLSTNIVFFHVAGFKESHYSQRAGAGLWGEALQCDHRRGRQRIWQRERFFQRAQLPHHPRVSIRTNGLRCETTAASQVRIGMNLTHLLTTADSHCIHFLFQRIWLQGSNVRVSVNRSPLKAEGRCYHLPHRSVSMHHRSTMSIVDFWLLHPFTEEWIRKSMIAKCNLLWFCTLDIS